MFRRVQRPQPPAKKKVVELMVSGWLGKWFNNHNWGAVTIPGPFVVFILYWTTNRLNSAPNRFIRLHEWQHVRQDEGNLCWLVSWAKYLWASVSKLNWRTVFKGSPGAALMDAYRANKYEAEAYLIESQAILSGSLPDWDK